MNQLAAAQSPEHREIARSMGRETETIAAVARERGRAETHEIFEARRVLIAELERRRR